MEQNSIIANLENVPWPVLLEDKEEEEEEEEEEEKGRRRRNGYICNFLVLSFPFFVFIVYICVSLCIVLFPRFLSYFMDGGKQR